MNDFLLVDVIVPVAVPNLFTYRVPTADLQKVKVGSRVVVAFGKTNHLVAIVAKLHKELPKEYQVNFYQELLDTEPIVTQQQINLWKWISSYYLCSIGEVLNAALPAGFKLNVESKIYLNPTAEINDNSLTDSEFLIVEALEIRGELAIQEVQEITQLTNVQVILKNLLAKQVIYIVEDAKEKFRPKTKDYILLTDIANEEPQLEQWFKELEKAPKQLELLMVYVQLNKRYSKDSQPVEKAKLLKQANTTHGVLNQLINKGVFQIETVEEGRLNTKIEKALEVSCIQLSNDQQLAFNNIKNQFEQKQVVLLNGVTASGKTEIYIHLIQEQLELGKQVLYLLPEIALTTQIINRLKKYFGNVVGVYHSKFNNNERIEVWNNLLNSKFQTYKIILGARSSIFLPFQNLGLVIVDEEHENTFKQFEPTPRYNARDSAFMLAQSFEAKVLLGSATPSLESYFNALSGNFGYVELFKRFANVQMPEILVADLQSEYKKKKIKGSFSELLYNKIEECLNNGEQIILFQNRRGFSPYIQCVECGWNINCVNCDVTLTYHKHISALKCHYCGYTISPPTKCGACGSNNLKQMGAGTERIEEQLSEFFPKANVARLDQDSTRSKNAYENILSDFADQRIHILVGTQMVTKGLDFENVALVGVLSADSLLNFPDFRAFERSFQLMSQVAGRAGRTHKRGTVVIQSFNPYNAVIQKVIENDYVGFATQQLYERKNFNYPPYFRLIRLQLVHKDKDLLRDASHTLAKELRAKFGNKKVLGPEFHLIARVKNQYRMELLLRFERGIGIKSIKQKITDLLNSFKQKKAYKPVRIVIDVDPY